MIKNLFIVAAAVIVASCGQEKKLDEEKKDSLKAKTNVDTASEKPVADTIIPIEQPIDLGTIPASMGLADRLKLLRSKYEVNYKEIFPEQQKVEVLDRFTSEKRYKIHLQKKMPVKYGKVENIFPVANIRLYIYEDSAQCANAVNNWYNCFGNDCSAITPGQEATIKSTPGFYIINQNAIICLDYKLEHSENNWSRLINHLKQLFGNNYSVCIRIKPHGKLTWEKR